MAVVKNKVLAAAVAMTLATVPAWGVTVSDNLGVNKQAVVNALANIQSNDFVVTLPSGRSITPYSQVDAKISLISRGNTTEPGVLAYISQIANPFPTVKYPMSISPLAFTLFGAGTQPVLMEAILHESDHRVYGQHTCGAAADADDNGPYGATSYYMLKVANYTVNLDTAQRNQAVANALYRATGNICDGAAQQRVLNAYFTGVFPQNCYLDESGQVLCVDNPNVGYVVKPRPDGTCYYNESGQLVC